MTSKSSPFSYWGKVDIPANRIHPLIYHCLDVATVAKIWLETSSALQGLLRRKFREQADCVQAWILFFTALHDLGKCDIRFQLKAPDIAAGMNPLFVPRNLSDSHSPVQYDHGRVGSGWFARELRLYGLAEYDNLNINDWMKLAAMHHGRGFSQCERSDFSGFARPEVIAQDSEARIKLVILLKELFLNDICHLTSPPDFFAGFCCVCDWLGSNEEYFRFLDPGIELEKYIGIRSEHAHRALRESGLLSVPASLPNTLWKDNFRDLFDAIQPRGVQTVIADLPVNEGLTIIEAPTGSGKTEAALFYAAHMLAQGRLDSIVFALPTQATANAMLERIENFSEKLFPDGSNLVLAHGKSRFNQRFRELVVRGYTASRPEGEEAAAQCSRWLAQSRKRVFLGQIGVCTVDQVLLSVLPVRHHFVRLFGVARSLLIVDEVHAYDCYMNGLLDRVLKYQRSVGGAALLLSATLNSQRRSELFAIWNADAVANLREFPYPVVSHSGSTGISVLEPKERPEQREVSLGLECGNQALPSIAILEKAAEMAASGARVALVCNLVTHAQRVASELHSLGANVMLFHSRFRFLDRDRIERRVIDSCGKNRNSDEGLVLVATQVVEQSLDLDFDWLITQLCPVDLLFQRVGRLHRHRRKRPAGLEKAICSVILPEGDGFGDHKYIYPNLRVLWRTKRLLELNSAIEFPAAYRDWIEQVYDPEQWPDEPEQITQAAERHEDYELGLRYSANILSSADTWFEDTDDRAVRLTRDGEMSLNVVPLIDGTGGPCFLGGDSLGRKDDPRRDESLMLNSVPVPASWKYSLPAPDNEDHMIFLRMDPTGENRWESVLSNRYSFTYSFTTGLERIKHEPSD